MAKFALAIPVVYYRASSRIAPTRSNWFPAAPTQTADNTMQDMLDVAEHPKGAAIQSLIRRRKQELSQLRRWKPPSTARARALDVLAVANEE